LRGFISEREKFIDSPIPEFYDLDNDFDELKNLAEKKKLGKYRKQLDQIIKTQSLPENIQAKKKVDRETREKLRSLGYISGSQVSKKESFGPKDDIKVLLPYHNKAMEAMDSYQEGKVKAALELLKEVITERKDVDIAYYHLATLYEAEGRLKEAVEVLKLGLENVPSSYEIFFAYVSHLLDVRQYDEVIRVITEKKGHQIEHDPEIWNGLGAAYSSKGDFEKAIVAYEKAISLDSEYSLVFRNLGHVYLLIFLRTKDIKNYQKALQNLNKAIELDPDYATAYHDLGIAYSQTRNFDEAIYCWKKALELRPDFDQILYNLGLAYLYKGDKFKALDYLSKYKKNFSHLLSPTQREKLEALIQECKQEQ